MSLWKPVSSSVAMSLNGPTTQTRYLDKYLSRRWPSLNPPSTLATSLVIATPVHLHLVFRPGLFWFTSLHLLSHNSWPSYPNLSPGTLKEQLSSPPPHPTCPSFIYSLHWTTGEFFFFFPKCSYVYVIHIFKGLPL